MVRGKVLGDAGAEEWHPVCRLDQLEVDRGAAALVHGRAVAVFRLADGSVYALGNHDPFAKAAVLARGIVGRRGEVPFVSLRIDATTLIDLVEAPRTGTNVDHVSLVVASDVDLEALARSGAFDVERGPSRIWGAQGHGLGLYVRDPDGNVIELKQYT